MSSTKIAIIGAGRVGTTTAYALMLKNLASEILLVDIDPMRCKGELLDLVDVLPFCATSSIKDATFSQAAQANIIIICAGIAQKPGQSRLDLLDNNKKVIDTIAQNLKPLNPDAIIIVVSNPLDLLTHYLIKKQLIPTQQIFGTGTYLDSMRLQILIAAKLNIAPESVHAWVLGEHGDSQFPAWSLASCAGLPVMQIKELTSSDLDQFAQQTKQKAYDIISCKGSTFYGIATCVAVFVQSIIFDEKKIFPVSWYHKDLGVCLSLPYILGKKGIEQVCDIQLTPKEMDLLLHSAKELEKMIDF